VVGGGGGVFWGWGVGCVCGGFLWGLCLCWCLVLGGVFLWFLLFLWVCGVFLVVLVFLGGLGFVCVFGFFFFFFLFFFFVFFFGIFFVFFFFCLFVVFFLFVCFFFFYVFFFFVWGVVFIGGGLFYLVWGLGRGSGVGSVVSDTELGGGCWGKGTRTTGPNLGPKKADSGAMWGVVGHLGKAVLFVEHNNFARWTTAPEKIGVGVYDW